MYRLAFTTLACPDWSWDEVVQKAVEYGYQGIEPRGVESEMDLTKSRPFTPRQLSATRRELSDRGLSIVCLDTSCRFHEASEIEANLDEGRRHIDLAAELASPPIRIFGDRIPEGVSREQVLDQVAGGLRTLAEYAEGSGVHVLLESHGDFSRSEDLLEAVRRVEHPQAGVLWDVHHPYRFHDEPVSLTYERIRDQIRHVHLKDSIPAAGGPRYCLLGQGDVPVSEVIQLVRGGGYDGWIALEWEKRWHPELEEPEVALPAFVETFRRLETASLTAETDEGQFADRQ